MWGQEASSIRDTEEGAGWENLKPWFIICGECYACISLITLLSIGLILDLVV